MKKFMTLEEWPQGTLRIYEGELPLTGGPADESRLLDVIELPGPCPYVVWPPVTVEHVAPRRGSLHSQEAFGELTWT